REIDDPRQLEPILVDKVELLANTGARETGKLDGLLGVARDKKRCVASLQAKRCADRLGALRPDVVGERASTLTAFTPHDVAEAGLAFALRPRVHPVAECTRATGRARNCPDAVLLVLEHPRKHLEARTAE